jgi:hypothetical protein
VERALAHFRRKIVALREQGWREPNEELRLTVRPIRIA